MYWGFTFNTSSKEIESKAPLRKKQPTAKKNPHIHTLTQTNAMNRALSQLKVSHRWQSVIHQSLWGGGGAGEVLAWNSLQELPQQTCHSDMKQDESIHIRGAVDMGADS